MNQTADCRGIRPLRVAVLIVLAAGTAACSRAAPTATNAAAAAPAVRWRTFTDPVEHAFTVEVPEGWTVRGGVRRMSALEIRSEVTARAPDGTVELFVGDADVPVFTLPNQMLAMAGFREGMVYSPGFGQNLVVASYQPGDAFAAGWGARRIGRVCAGAAPTDSHSLPQAERAIDMAYAQGGVRTSIRAGEARFGCSMNGQRGAGYAFAATELVQTAGNGLWDAKVLAGFASRADRSALAGQLLSHAVASFRVDPDWAARQQGLTAAVSRITTQTNEAVSRSIHDSFAYQQQIRDRSAERVDQGVRGTETFEDPVAGPRELENAPHQWRTQDGRTVATDAAEPPEPGAVELQRRP